MLTLVVVCLPVGVSG